MSVQKNYIHAPMQAVTHGAIRAHFRFRLPRFPRWFPYRRKDNSLPIIAANFALGDERYANDGYYRVSAEQAGQEQAIDIETINLLQPCIR